VLPDAAGAGRRFERVHPKKPGMRDCKKSNNKEIKVDLVQ